MAVVLFIAIIGSILLCLPIAAKSGQWTPFVNAAFTSVSALCVTGLVVYDTYAHWSLFGQIIILILIQIGGIGFMTIITSFSLVIKRKMGLHERQLLMESSGLLHATNLRSLIKRITIFVLLIEFVGAALLSLRFVPEFGWVQGIYYGIFHSISAFCNAGFDLMGRFGQYRSLTTYVADPLVTLTISVLIILGGLGFMVWDDILRHGKKIRKYSLHTKIVLFMTSILLFGGWLGFYLLEYRYGLKGLSEPTKILSSFFLAVSPRTAGFSTISLSHLSDSGQFLTMILMNIGGASGSTSGGLKVTTFAVLLFSAISSAQRVPTTEVFKRRFDDETVKQASALLTFYIILGMSGTLILSALNSFRLEAIFFEVFSALGTAGLTLGITPQLDSLSKVVLILFMFVGRVGWMMLIFSLLGKNQTPPIRRVSEKILVG